MRRRAGTEDLQDPLRLRRMVRQPSPWLPPRYRKAIAQPGARSRRDRPSRYRHLLENRGGWWKGRSSRPRSSIDINQLVGVQVLAKRRESVAIDQTGGVGHFVAGGRPAQGEGEGAVALIDGSRTDLTAEAVGEGVGDVDGGPVIEHGECLQRGCGRRPPSAPKALSGQSRSVKTSR